MAEPVVVYTVDGPVATVTLNRPAADADEAVHAIILTGADPAFCAGVDLKELGRETSVLRAGQPGSHSPWPPASKPVIAAVNGPAVTGGLELVLNCDIVICSERAVFADTHARVGVLPGWGLSVLLPLAVGRSRARQMSFTGDFLPAAQALTAGLVSEVVRHDNLLGRAREIAGPSRATTPRPCGRCWRPIARSRPRSWPAASPPRSRRPGPGAVRAWTWRKPDAGGPR